jgi:hypothetical protein
LEWYGVTAFAMLVLAGRIGAWENYFFEALAVACVFLGFQISQSSLSNFQLPISNFQFVLPILLIVQLALMWRDHDPRIAANLMAESFPANQQLSELLKRTPGVVISEDMGALAMSGKMVPFYTFQYSMLARSGKWDQNWELNGLRDGVFPLVILENGTREDVDHYRRFTREFVSALDRYYARSQAIGKYEIYTPAPPLKLQSADFGDAIALVGWNAQPETLQPGTLKLDVVWQAQRAMERRYKAFVTLEKLDGNKVTQDDHEPRHGDYPTTHWAANEMARETYSLNIPNDLSPGKYALKAGWYDFDTGDRLEVAGSADNTIVLATYEVKN